MFTHPKLKVYEKAVIFAAAAEEFSAPWGKRQAKATDCCQVDKVSDKVSDKGRPKALSKCASALVNKDKLIAGHERTHKTGPGTALVILGTSRLPIHIGSYVLKCAQQFVA